jgi:excisionase family DNA binding protein
LDNPLQRNPAPQLIPKLGLRPREAAKSIGVSLSTLQRLTKTGELASVKLARATIYYQQELERWLGVRTELARNQQARPHIDHAGVIDAAKTPANTRRRGEHEDAEPTD